MTAPRPLKAPTGGTLACASWLLEAPYRMLQNNLDPAVAERPDDLVVYGGSGKAARNWECLDSILTTLRGMAPDDTLLIQSGKPVGVFKTHADAPRVLLANSNLVGHWATWEHFNALEKAGLMMFGQMTAGSWIYIGSQGIVQGTYETFAELARRHFGGSLKHRLVVSGGLGGMGGAQPLAAVMAGGVFLGADVDRSRIEKRLATRYCDVVTDSIDDAIRQAMSWKAAGEAKSIGVVANQADLLAEMLKRNITPDVLTDQTSAHDPLNGYVPNRMPYEAAMALRQRDPAVYQRESIRTMCEHVRHMLDLQTRGAVTFDYGNNIRGFALQGGVANAFNFKGFVPLYIRPLFCQGKGPFRWVALSGDPQDIYKTDEVILREFADNNLLCNWIRLARERIAFQGLPARICWLGYGERAKFGRLLNDMVASGELKAPIVIGRDHLDCGSVASPNRETESMKDGSDAVADWPILNALINTAGGATWVSFHHGGGVGIGYSLHAGMVVVADGTPDAARRLERVLTTDPGLGVMRHADAGYDEAVEFARQHGIRIPMLQSRD